MTIESRIAALVALGVEGVRVAPIPPSVAQECARRWLIDAARDTERARARAVESAAEKPRPSLDLESVTSSPEARARRARFEQEQAARAAEARAFDSWATSVGSFCIHMVGYGLTPGRVIEMYATTGLRRPSYRPDREKWEPLNRKMRALYTAGNLTEAGNVLVEMASIQYVAERDIRVEARREWLLHLDVEIERRASELNIDWTATLLTTTVALPDGTRVEWGEATREQHVARLDMLTKHAATELETATRHRAAINAIDTTGVSCLNELASVAK